MATYYPVALVALLSCVMHFGMALAVARAHIRSGILAPKMTGNPALERTVRAHTNTLEWLPIFLTSMWLFAIYWSVPWAAGLGILWILGRIIYFLGSVHAAKRRFPGFFIQSLAAMALLLGPLGRIAYLMLTPPTI